MKTYYLVDLGALRDGSNSREHIDDLIKDAEARGQTLVLVKPMSTIIDTDRTSRMHRDRERGPGQRPSDPWSMIMSAITDLQSAVSKNTTVIESALTLIQGFKAAAAESSDPAMQAFAKELNDESDKLAAAVLANTAAAKTEPSTEAPASDSPA